MNRVHNPLGISIWINNIRKIKWIRVYSIQNFVKIKFKEKNIRFSGFLIQLLMEVKNVKILLLWQTKIDAETVETVIYPTLN